MARTTRHTLAGAVVVALMLTLGGIAQAGDDDERSATWTPTWALGDILQGLAHAMNGAQDGLERAFSAAPLQMTEASTVPAGPRQVDPSAPRGTGAAVRNGPAVTR